MMQQSKRILLVGTPSGGTSAVSGVLHHLGVDMGIGNVQSPRGFPKYEDPLLGKYRGGQKRVRLAAYFAARERAGSGGHVGVKINSAIPGWPVIKGAGTDLVVVSRPLEEAIRSDWRVESRLHEERPDLRPDPPDREARAAAVAHSWTAVQSLAPHASVVVSFGYLREEPEPVILSIAKALGLQPAAEQVAAAVASIRPLAKRPKMPMSRFWETETTNEAGFLLDLIPEDRPVVGAEIGTLIAKSSCIMLTRRPKLRLYLVDDWQNRPYAKEIAERHLLEAGVGDRAAILHGDSSGMAAHVPDGSLDFAFIDASKNQEQYRADCLAWLPKVKPGGHLTGHDWKTATVPPVVGELENLLGLRAAVDEKRDAWSIRLP